MAVLHLCSSYMVPISVLIPTRNERQNIARCLEPLQGWADEVVVVDSQSNDGTIEIAKDMGATVLQFDYHGGWPKKRQWALDTYAFRNDWILLLDADEILLDPIKREIADAIASPGVDGFWLRFQVHFLGRQLRFGDTELWKLFLFRKGKGRYERRLIDQDQSMSDIEVHEHIVLDGRSGRLQNPIRHENINSLDRYIQKHNEYSNWEAKVWVAGADDGIQPSLFGSQAQRRRWLKRKFLHLPGTPVLFFVYKYSSSSGSWMEGRASCTPAFRAFSFFTSRRRSTSCSNCWKGSRKSG
jgi:glycosyltransferase involved in cell wall biosynthesis